MQFMVDGAAGSAGAYLVFFNFVKVANDCRPNHRPCEFVTLTQRENNI